MTQTTAAILVAAGLYGFAGLTFGAGPGHDQLTLEQSLRIALQNHRSAQVSQAALEMAEAQYRQAMAAFGPRLGLEAGIQRADEDRTFTFQGIVTTPTMNLPLGPGGMPIPIPGQPLPINLDVKLYDRDVATLGMNLSYPLYTGGKKEAIAGMAMKGVEIAREDKRKTDLEIVREVQRYYNGAQFAAKMEQLASDTLERFQALEDLTDRLYQNASLKVKKTDYLRSKTTTAMTRSILQEAKYASTLTKEALANAMGLPVNSPLSLASEGALPGFDGALEGLVADAMKFNPDKQRLELAVQAVDHRIDEAKSGHKPMVGLEASVYKVWNDYKGGLFNSDNRDGWTLGIGVKWDLFDSGLTRAGVDAAHAGKMKLEAQRVLLDNGLALQIKDDFLRIQRSRAQVGDSGKAREYAEENRKLHVRAYQEEMVETKDVIESQIVETFAAANLYRAEHDLRAALADLDYRVGKGLRQAQP
ncbi:MAG: TolC family protein [Hydrogenophilales bacterium]|nr:TolC family protein [Hydrogenophilales bacterium]